MVKRFMKLKSSPSTGNPTIIGAETSVSGNLTVEGDIRIDGELKGMLCCKGRLVLGEFGSIRADRIGCAEADIAGLVEGVLVVNGLLRVRANGCVDGSVSVARLAIEPGGRLNGHCFMGNQDTILPELSSSLVSNKGMSEAKTFPCKGMESIP